jgi:cytochrome c-type biogenesis protein CcmH
VLEKRVTALSEELRCLVCQNQTLADSHADLALDLKKQVREKLAAGMSDREVIDFMVERYGDFVLYKPPFRAATWVLWAGPFVLLAFGMGVLIRATKARRRMPDARDAATDAALQKAVRMLEEGSGARS